MKMLFMTLPTAAFLGAIAMTSFAATPADTNVQKLETVVAQLKDAVVDVTVQEDLDLLLRIADSFRAEYPDDFAAYVLDPANPTNQERAGFVLVKIKAYGQDILRRQAAIAKEAELLTTPIADAADAAALDLE